MSTPTVADLRALVTSTALTAEEERLLVDECWRHCEKAARRNAETVCVRLIVLGGVLSRGEGWQLHAANMKPVCAQLCARGITAACTRDAVHMYGWLGPLANP